jgi:hypothetical protein
LKVEYALVLAVISAAYLAVKQWLPDFPVPDEVFQVVILWLLAKLGVEVAGVPANKLRGTRG